MKTAQILGCKIVHGRPRHPQSQGVVERVNQTIKSKIIANSTPWSAQISEIVINYNNSYHSSTKFTPNQMEGREIQHSSRLSILSVNNLSIEQIHLQALQNLQNNAERMKKFHKKIFREKIEPKSIVLVRPPPTNKIKTKREFLYKARVIQETAKNSGIFTIKWLTNGFLQSQIPDSECNVSISQLKLSKFHEEGEIKEDEHEDIIGIDYFDKEDEEGNGNEDMRVELEELAKEDWNSDNSDFELNKRNININNNNNNNEEINTEINNNNKNKNKNKNINNNINNKENNEREKISIKKTNSSHKLINTSDKRKRKRKEDDNFLYYSKKR